MHRITQKIQNLGIVVALLVIPALAPLLSSKPAFALKTYPKGTCFVQQEGQKPTIDNPCTASDKRTVKNSSLGSYDASKCYGINGSTAGSNVQVVNCDNTSATTPTQMCPSDKDPTKSVQCITCPDGISQVASQADCPQGDAAATGGTCASVSQCDLLSKYVNPFITFLAALVGVATVISIIIGGIQYSSSAGDPAKATAAKNRIRNAIIALVTFIFLYALLNFLIPGGLFNK